MLLALAAGCGTSEVGASSQPVVGGYDDSSAGPTVAVMRCDGACAFTPYLNAVEICSGTLVAPNLVLTARHCVAPQVDDDDGVECSKTTFGPTYPGDQFVVTPADSVFAGGPWYFGMAVAVDGKDGDFVCGSDVATIELRASYVGASPMVPRLTTPPAKGETYSAIGYGDDMDGGLGYRHRRDGLVVQCVGSKGCNLIGPDHATLVEDDELMGQTGLCGGDSGGPAVDANGLLFGVTSRADATDCTTPVYSRIDSHADWLRAQATRAASDGDYPLASWAFGQPPDGGADAATLDAGGQVADASAGPPAETAASAVGGCGVGGRGRGAESAIEVALLFLLLRSARRGSRSIA